LGLADKADVSAMSHAHTDKFERIKREHGVVVSLLKSSLENRKGAKSRQKAQFHGLSLKDEDIQDHLETAAATANDAYALLLMATSEGFLRAYIDSLGINLGSEPKLRMLIDKCCKEFKKRNPQIPIRSETIREVRDLCVQRNEYAHGHRLGGFPSIGSMVTTLGRFFDQFP
jgi:hypothetical protein